MHSLAAPSQWLARELSTLLLSSPSEMQVTPQDFDTLFNSVFMPHARGLVGGREVDREQLKESLLALQKRWNPATCRYEDCKLHWRIDGFHPEVGFKMEFLSPQSDVGHIITCEACVAKKGGVRRIKMLMLEGDPSLFRA